MPLDYYKPGSGDSNASLPMSITSLVCAAFPVIVWLLEARAVSCFTMLSPLIGSLLGIIAYLSAPSDQEWIGLLALIANAGVIAIAVLAVPHYF